MVFSRSLGGEGKGGSHIPIYMAHIRGGTVMDWREGRRTLSGTVRTAYISRGGGDRQIDRKTDGQTDGWTDRRIDNQMDRQMDRYVYRKVDRQTEG
jgi:hypothetical protein